MEIIIYNAYFFKNRSWKSTNQLFKKYQVLTLESGQGIRGQAINHGISVFLKGPEKTGVASLLTGFHLWNQKQGLTRPQMGQHLNLRISSFQNCEK